MAKTKKNLNILFTCIGRRVSLQRAFRSAAKSLGLNCSVFGTERTELSSALQSCDKAFVVHPVTHRRYISQLLSIVKSHHIRLLIPTVDLDLKELAVNRQKFDALGCRVLVSKPYVINICHDKRKTYRFLIENGFDSPLTLSPREVLSKRTFNGPYFMKPWDGYAARGNAVIKNRKDLEFYSQKVPNPICQELVRGQEVTCDAYVDFDMKVRCVVPRRRLEIRAGEVSKARVVKNKHIMKLVKSLVEKLGAGPGVITIQLFRTLDKKIKFIEINPRFGGGVPLSIKAGANFPKWILQQLTGRKPRIPFDGFKDGLTMLRYDAEIWLPAPSARKK
jgi:carbamoyl-phosphate synthase large subunit